MPDRYTVGQIEHLLEIYVVIDQYLDQYFDCSYYKDTAHSDAKGLNTNDPYYTRERFSWKHVSNDQYVEGGG